MVTFSAISVELVRAGHFFSARRLARALAGARVGAGALAAHRQAAAMAEAAIAAEVHQRLMFIDISRRRSPSIVDAADLLAQLLEVGVGQVLDLAVVAARRAASQISARAARPMP